MAEHIFTEGEKKCLEEYWRECSKTPRKNLMKLVSHINMFNPFPNEKSWEYIFYDRQLTNEQIDFALKMRDVAKMQKQREKDSWGAAVPGKRYRLLNINK